MVSVTSHLQAAPTQRNITSITVQNHTVTQIPSKTRAVKTAKTQSNEPLNLLPNSNAGGDKITEVALDYWRRLKRREDIPAEELQDVLSEEIFRNPNSEYSTSGLMCVGQFSAGCSAKHEAVLPPEHTDGKALHALSSRWFLSKPTDPEEPD